MRYLGKARSQAGLTLTVFAFSIIAFFVPIAANATTFDLTNLVSRQVQLDHITIVNSGTGIEVNNTRGFSASNISIKNTTTPFRFNNAEDVSLNNVKINSDSNSDEWFSPSNIVAIIGGIAVPSVGFVLGYKVKRSRKKKSKKDGQPK